MLIFLIFCIGFIRCQYIDDNIFERIRNVKSVSTVKIANFHYSAIDEPTKYFLPKNIKIEKRGIYPYDVDLPRILPRIDLELKSIPENTMNNSNINEIERLIQEVDFITGLPPFKITGGISILQNKVNQVLLVWNSNRTFLILIQPSSVQNDYSIYLGRDLMHYDCLKKLPTDYLRSERLIFEISTNILIKFGCQKIFKNLDNKNETTELPLSMSKYRLKNLGGEKILIQGPCFNNSETTPYLEIRSINNPNLTIPKVSLTFENNSFIFLSPCLWYIGLYQFKISYENYDFISDVEIYSIDGDDSNIQIDRIEQEYIELKISNYAQSMNFSLYTLDLFNNDQNQIPFKLVKTSIPVSPKLKLVRLEFRDISDGYINIYQQIGFIGYVDQSNETKWTNSFSFIGMKKSLVIKDPEYQCKNTLSKSSVEKIHFCPDKLKQAAGLLSTFRILLSNVDYFSSHNEKYICFVQVIISEDGNGVTCCYNKTTNNLIYGQDFYLRNNTLIGSYSWKISPFYDLQKHFIKDLIPMHSCCSIINNEFLCSEFWNKSNSINIKSFEEDLRADVFGDPHFIPYKSTSNYSFLGMGDFQLILTKNNEFNLQGRFYNNDEKLRSLLKAIVFKIPSIRMSITTSSNNKTNLHWKILTEIQNRSFIEYLPFHQENLLIFQSNDTTMLHIYLRISNDSRIYIGLERIYYNENISEFINMRVHLSNNMKDKVIGGLFGRIDNNSQSTGLYSQNSIDFIEDTRNFEKIYDFSKTWKLKIDKNLFFDPNFNMADDKYAKPGIDSSVKCPNLVFCKIDAFYYSDDVVQKKTINANDYRVNLDEEWRSLVSEAGVCDRPPIKMVKYNSDNFTESSQIYITGCLDPNKALTIQNTSMECQRKSNLSELGWKVYFQNDICQKIKGPDKKSASENEIVYAAIGASVLLLVILCVIVAYFLVKRKKKVASNPKRDIELSTVSNMTVETTYDTVIGKEDEYFTYAEIQKTK